MGFGFGQDGYRWGFSSVRDWLDSVIVSFPAPWSVRPLDGKYYGTEIADARGLVIMTVWLSWGEPSTRELGSMTREQWSEYCCDSHWECVDALRICETIVSLRNLLANDKAWHHDEREADMLRHLIIDYADWNEEIDDEIKCGGPLRRETSSEHDTHDQMGGMSSEYRKQLAAREKRVCKTCSELRVAKVEETKWRHRK